MTIDEMLEQVAKNVGVSAPKKVAPVAGKKSSGGEEHKCLCKKEKSFDGKLSLEAAKFVAQGIEIAAKKMGVSVVIAVDNDGANLVLLHAMDDSYIASISASQEKAYTAMALKMPTEVALKESRGGSLDGLTNGNGLLLLGGGCPFVRDGKLYGSVGVSGGTKEQDILLARIGAELFCKF